MVMGLVEKVEGKGLILFCSICPQQLYIYWINGGVRYIFCELVGKVDLLEKSQLRISSSLILSNFHLNSRYWEKEEMLLIRFLSVMRYSSQKDSVIGSLVLWVWVYEVLIELF